MKNTAMRTVTVSEHFLPDIPILTSAETARYMAFGSTEALARARLAGRLPIRMFKLPGRRGWFAATRDVRAWIEASLESAPSGPESHPTEALARTRPSVVQR